MVEYWIININAASFSISAIPEFLHLFMLIRWALGTLFYFMIQGEIPFGSWRESELAFPKIAKGQVTFHKCSP